jgi:hypothetical protein
MNVNRKNPTAVVGKAKDMDDGTVSNPALFVTPNPPNPAFQIQIQVTDKAIVTASKGSQADTAARNVQCGLLVGMMETRCVYVQGVADTAATPQQAAATIRAGKLDVAAVGDHIKDILTVTQGPQSGAVALDAFAKALAGKGTRTKFFGWQSTTDGKTFITLPSTSKAKTTVANLTPLTQYGFRVNVTLSDGVPGEWSQIVYFFVH